MAPNINQLNQMTATITQSAAEAVKELAARYGGNITPDIVLDAARPATSPLHGIFQWDDSKAAEEYRLMQAAHLIRRIKVTIPAGEGRSVTVRAFVNVRNEDAESDSSRGFYVPVETALAVSDYRSQIIAQCKRDIAAFRAKYAALTEAGRIIQAMNQFEP